jgi:ribosomal-protein-alanine N-acetyltransferase
MKFKYEIVRAKFVHLDEVARIEEENFPCPWKKEYFEQELIQPLRYNIVMILKEGEKQKLIGYLFSHYANDELHIAKIATDKQYQRMGVSTALMDRCISFCKLKKINYISLEVRVSNAPAIKFYEKYNFEKLYIRKNYYPDGEDAFFMMKTL